MNERIAGRLEEYKKMGRTNGADPAGEFCLRRSKDLLFRRRAFRACAATGLMARKPRLKRPLADSRHL